MKLTTFLLLIAVFQLYASETYSQDTKLTLDLGETTVEQVLKIIENQSEFYFLFNQKLVDIDRGVNLQVAEQNISEILTQVFEGTDVDYVVMDRQIVLSPGEYLTDVKAKLQVIQISGTVTDNEGNPLPGVNIVLKGTITGTITDTNGNFSIEVDDPASVLVFSYVGYQVQEVLVGNQTTMNITLLEETVGIDEVVVIGYGTQKKANLTAAVEMVDLAMLENRPVRTVGEMLEGVVPNLNISVNSGAPDATPDFNIRGFTGFGSSAQPLILIDGVEQDINMINANDIESVSILKDAAASAIYGSRAPHGVILINTKSGKKGQKMQINYSGDYIINQPTYIFQPGDSYTWATNTNNKAYNSFQGAKFSDETIQGILDNAAGLGPSNVIGTNGRYQAHFGATNATENRLETAFRDYSTNVSHNLNVMGGTDNTTYYVGVGYIEKQGIYDSPVDQNERYSVLTKINTDLTNWLSVHSNLRYARQESARPSIERGGGGASSFATDSQILGGGNLYYFPNVPSINPNGEWHWLSVIPTIRGESGQRNTDQVDMLISGGFDLKPIKGLLIRGDFSFIDNSVLSNKITKQVIVEDADGTTRHTARTAKFDEVEETMSKLLGHTIDLNATYSKKIDKHDFLAMAGYQQDTRHFHQLRASNRDVYTTDVMTLSTTYGSDIKADDELWHWATRGYFLRASYNFDGKYMVDFNGRYDAASKYAADSRWAFFPSVSIGYNIAKEDFWPVDDIQMFKLTGSWGKLGDQAGGNYQYIPTMGTNAQTPYLLNNSRPPYVTMPGMISPTLTWAKPRTIGLGLEVSAFNNRLQTEYRWYQRTVLDQLGPAEKYPEVLGTNPPQDNNAVSETRGWELSLAWRDQAFDILGSSVRYEVRGVLADYIGYVVEYEDNTSGKRTDTWTPGEVFGILYGYSGQEIITDASQLTEQFLWRDGWNYPGSTYIPDVNGDGRLNSGDGSFWYSEGDRVNLGYTYPRYKYSLLFSTGWRSFDLSVFLDGVGKEVRYSTHPMFIGNTRGGYPSHTLAMHQELGYWSLDNPDGFYPRMFQTGGSGIQPTEKYMMNLAHLRIKNVSLSYNLPQKLANKATLSYIKLNLSVENLGFVYNKLRVPMDPVQVRTNSGQTYPVQRVFSFGIRVGI